MTLRFQVNEFVNGNRSLFLTIVNSHKKSLLAKKLEKISHALLILNQFKLTRLRIKKTLASYLTFD